MLILTRKRSEMIRIGDQIVIKVIRLGRSSVKLGVAAPADVKVLRAELADQEVLARKGDVIELPDPRPTAADAAQFERIPRPHVV